MMDPEFGCSRVKRDLVWEIARHGSIEMMQVAFDCGATIEKNADDPPSFRALFSANKRVDAQMVKLLISKGADANSLGKGFCGGIRPYHYDQKDSKGFATTYHAVHHSDLQMCKLLVEAGARPGSEDLTS
jgi:ankyrin repeat protein